MSILKNIIKEMAASGSTGAGSVAGFHGSLFGGGTVTRNGTAGRKMADAYRLKVGDMSKKIKNRNQWKWRIIGEMVEDNQQFDPADVESKLNAAERRANQDEDTVPFGMEDEDGNIVKVYVRSEQADEFESALASMLAGEDEDDDEINTSVEIAEVLFKLKDKFDIVDVKWPEIEGDEEEEQEMADDGADFGEEGDMGGDEMGGEEGDMEDTGDLGPEGEGDMDLGGDVEMEPEGGAESALQQVIDMMKADAEARKAESEARAKEAEARAAEANASSAASKVKQEEEVLDMEAYNKQVKSEEEEAQRLAKLAKFKHDQASRYETSLAQEEEEASMKNDNEGFRTRPHEREDSVITKNELMTRILDYLKAN